MQIEKFSKQKNGMYFLTLEDGNKIKIHEDLILKYGLLLNKKIDDTLFDELNQQNQVYIVYEIALKCLNIRLRSRKELSEYLRKKGYEQSIIHSVLEMLSNQGYLDDKVYATSFVHDRILMSSDGPGKIRGELERCGISSEIIIEALVLFDENLERERIEKLVNKQIKSNHDKGPFVLKKKIQSYLLSLGYSITLVNSALNEKKLVDEECYQKEYDKLYMKLGKKYSGKELEYKLKQKMYQKGFTNSSFE